MLSERQKGVFLVVVAGMGFAFLPTITRTIYQVSDLTPTDVGFWRFLFASTVLWAIVGWRTRGKGIKPPIPLPYILLLGILYAIPAMSAFFSLQYISGSLFIVLTYTYPALVALLSLVMGVRLSLTAWLAVGLTLVGVVLTVPDSRQLQAGSVLGVVIALTGAFVLAWYFIASNRLMRGVTDIVQGTAWVISAMFCAVACLAIFFGVHVPNLPALALLIALALVCTVMPIFSLNAGIQRLGAAQASIISSIEAVLAMLVGIIVLGEVVTLIQWVGAGLIISAVILLESRPKAKPEPALSSKSSVL